MPVGNRHETIDPSYRPKCAGGSTSPALGDCQSSPKSSGKYIVQKWDNVTQVNNFGSCENGCCPDPATVAPYPRIEDPDAYEPCDGSSANPLDCGGPCNAPCLAWINTGAGFTPDQLVMAGYPSGVNQIGHNYYQPTTGTYDLRVCKPYGFKNAQAQKNWHGRWGFCYDDGTMLFALDSLFGGTSCSGCNVFYPRPNNIWQTKYLTANATAYYKETATDDSIVDESTSAATVSIGRYNGVKTVQSFQSGDSFSDGILAALDNGDICSPEGAPSSPYGAYINALTPLVTANIDAGNSQYVGTETVSDDGRVRSATVAYGPDNFLYSFFGGATVLTASMSIGDGGGSVDYSYDDQDGNTETLTASWGCDSFTFVRTYGSTDEESGDGTAITILSGTIELTDPYEAEDVYIDVKGLLAQLNLTDDVSYPWRTDEHTTIAPLVTYNEAPTVAPSVVDAYYLDDSGNAHAQIDPQSYIRDGSIMGSPLPNGYSHFFDWEHKTYNYCQGPLGQDIFWEQNVGAQNLTALTTDITDMVCPMSTTRWTNNYNGGLYPNNGAWVMYGDKVGSTLVAQKWAEILLPHPSQNFARPCGADRYDLVESSVRCITGIAGTGIGATLQIDTLYPGDSNIQTNDIVLINGFGFQGGYKVSRTDQNNFVVTSGIFSGVDFSTLNLETAIDANTMGKMRFPNVPALCGSVPVTNAKGSISGNILVTTAEFNYLRSGDTVNLDVQGLSPSYTVIPVSNFSFSLAGTSGQTGNFGSTVIFGGYDNKAKTCLGFVSSPLGTPEQWNDSESKGNFVYGSHTFNNRTIGQWADNAAPYATCNGCIAVPSAVRPTQAANGLSNTIGGMTVDALCLPNVNCSPKVFCISPNSGEVFANGITMDFPSSFALDERYGSQWQARVSQVRQDMFWQVPHKPCHPRLGCDDTDDGTHTQRGALRWAEDSEGNCTSDHCDPDGGGGTIETDVYPIRGYVEDMVDLPAGVSLPQVAGVTFGYYSYSDLQSAISTPVKNVFQPANIGGWVFLTPVPNTFTGPWNVYFGQCNCTASDGIYSQLYEDRDGVKCVFVPSP